MEQILAELMEYFRALLLFQADREYQEIYLTDTRKPWSRRQAFLPETRSWPMWNGSMRQ